jgi:hypothetical protein
MGMPRAGEITNILEDYETGKLSPHDLKDVKIQSSPSRIEVT